MINEKNRISEMNMIRYHIANEPEPSRTNQGLPAPHCAVYASQLGLVGFLVVGLEEIGATVGFEDFGADEGARVTGAVDKGASVTG